MRDQADSSARSTGREIRDLVALSTLPAMWPGADPVRVAEGLASALLATTGADLVCVCLEAGRDPAVAVAQTGRYRADAALGARLSGRILAWARTHDPDEPLAISNPLGQGEMRLLVRGLGFDASLGAIAAGYGAPRLPEAFDHSLLAVAATQGTLALQNGRLLRGLRESEERYRGIFEGAGVSIWHQDFTEVKTALDLLERSGMTDYRRYFAEHPGFVERAIGMVRIVDVNDATVAMFGAASKAELTASLAAIFVPESRPVFVEALVAIAEGRRELECEVRLRTLTGDLRDFLLTIAFPPPERPLDRVLVTLVDISERQILVRTGAALAGETNLQRAVQVVTDAATGVCGAKFGAFFYNATNDAGESYLLYTLSGAPREAFARFGAPRNTALFAPTFAGQGVVRLPDVTKDERYGRNAPHRGMPEGHLPVRSYLAVPVASRTGEVIGGLFFGHPEPGVFTERAERIVLGIASQAAVAIDNARLHEQRGRLIEQLRESDQRKDDFLAMLSHELRNPLAPIRMAVALLEDDDPALRARARGILERQVAHMIRLVDDLLDISRISRGAIALERRAVELGAIIAAAVETSRPLIDAAGQRLEIDLPAAKTVLTADAVRLTQVIANLLNNAVKYTPAAGRIRLSARSDGSEARVSVSDTGIGIEPRDLDRIFEMFAQTDASRRQAPGGLGVGLALSRQIVELHGGSIEVRSEGPGRGAEFVVRLPLAAAAARTSAPEPQRRRASVPRRVLVADDNADAAAMLEAVLGQMGHAVRVAHDGEAALRLALAEPPDVILLDLGMPKQDGYEVAARLRQDARFDAVPLIAVTGYAQEIDRSKARSAGFDEHLVKPVDPDLLCAALETVRWKKESISS